MRNSLPSWVWVGSGFGKKLRLAGLEGEGPQGGSRQPQAGSTAGSTLLRVALAAILVVASGAPANSDQAKSAYKRGVRAEAKVDYDAAFQAYSEAHRLKPNDSRYLGSFLRVRSTAGLEHVRKGQMLRDNFKLQEALSEFQRASDIDPTNSVAKQEAEVTSVLIKKQALQAFAVTLTPVSPLVQKAATTGGPVELEPISNTPLTLRMTTTTDNVYKTIGKLAGINVLFDMDYKPQRVTIELDEVPLLEALRMVALESKTFWRPISTKAIFVAADSRRKEYEDNVMTTFYVRNAGTPAELQEIVGTIKGILDISRIQVNPTHSSITLRGTPDQMVLAQKLINDLDKAKAEVVIDIVVMEVSSNWSRTLGTTVPTADNVAVQAAGGAGTVNFGGLNGGKFVVGVPSVSFTALMSDSKTRILQNPEIRVLDLGKASLKIGDRIPIATGSFAATGSGVSPLVNTQFQYLDVGFNLDITPHVLSDREVDVKMVLEVSSKTGSVNIGGIDQPTIGQRHIEHEMRLGDGQINLVGGFLKDSDTADVGGYPWLGSLPLLKYLFGQEVKTRDKSEIIFAIVPHIVRAETITDENLRLIDIGTGSTIDLRQVDQTKKPGSESQTAKPGAQPVTPPKAPSGAPAPATPAVPPAR